MKTEFCFFFVIILVKVNICFNFKKLYIYIYRTFFIIYFSLISPLIYYDLKVTNLNLKNNLLHIRLFSEISYGENLVHQTVLYPIDTLCWI